MAERKKKKSLYDYDRKLFTENEMNANYYLARLLAIFGGILIIIFLLYLFRVFEIRDYTAVYVFFPMNAAILIVPIFLEKTKIKYSPYFKYFLLGLFILVISLINLIIPKHGILGWACCVVLATHYYEPKVGRIVFGVTLAMMLLCILGGMVYGEWDANLLNGNFHELNGVDESLYITPESRFEYLREMLEVHGENRWLTAVGFYYMPRALFLTITFLITETLSRRTREMLKRSAISAMEKERMGTELSIASKIQIAMLPVNYPKSSKYDLYALMDPAKEVGGDFYDFFRIDDSHVCFLVADVSGKGIPAAIFMAITKVLLKTNMKPGSSPDDVVSYINELLCKDNEAGMFVTAWVGVLNTETRVLNFVNAGHNPPLFRKGNDEFTFLKTKPGLVMGGLAGYKYNKSSIEVPDGFSIIMYTDGVTEATNSVNEMFGEDRLIKEANSDIDLCCEEIARNIRGKISEFVDGAAQFDDITMLCFQFSPETKSELNKGV